MKNKKVIPKDKSKTKPVDPKDTYLKQFKNKQEHSRSNIDESAQQQPSTFVKGGINFDELDDWNEVESASKSKCLTEL